MCETIKTGIAALDLMLGGRGIPVGSLVLLRGGPGTGKTTLALQIISYHLCQQAPNKYAAFVSLETDPIRAQDYVTSAFGLRFPDPERSPFVHVGRKWIRELGGDENTLDDFAATLRNEVEDKLIPEIARTSEELGTFQGLIVIDSLNLLATMPMVVHENDLRGAMYRVWNSLEPLKDKATVLLIAEYDPQSERNMSVAAESYFCDVEIQLVREEVVRSRGAIPSEAKTQGGLLGKWTLPTPHTLETRFFCRVNKCRRGPSQTRRCAYDIVSDRGIVLYETYPADGQLMLFAENLPQQEEWESFFATDVMQLYPALQFDIFGRAGLQRIAASLRRFLKIPERTELYLSSSDTYWINWFKELSQRYELVRELRHVLQCGTDPELRSRFSKIVGTTHGRFARWLSSGQESGKVPQFAKELWRQICEEKKNICTRAKQCDDESCTRGALKEGIENAWKKTLSPGWQGGLLHSIPDDKVRLFGHLKSKIIHELDADQSQKGHTPVFRAPVRGDAGKLLAVPYNANIGMFVCRKDILEQIATPEHRKSLIEEVKGLHKKRVNAVEKFIRSTKLNFKIPSDLKKPAAITRTAEERVDKLLETKLPTTWEEVIALCAPENGPTRHCLIETRTFDTQLCTFLEWLWGLGGNLKIWPDHSVDQRSESVVRLFEAFWIFRTMRQKGIIPRNSTLEAAEFGRRYSKPRANATRHAKDRSQDARDDDLAQLSPPPTDEPKATDWLFARHWHSTFVDILTTKRDETHFAWEPPGNVKLEVTCIPATISAYITTPANNRKMMHASCWGEWYLTFLRGSENEALAIDLINNLMSGRKICERAFSCAALPTVEEFYKMYGDARCFNIPDRSDIQLPEITFSQLRKRLFGSAKTRTDVFDYRHCMGELHPLLEHVHDFPDIKPAKMGKQIREALDNIESLGATETLPGEADEEEVRP